MNFWMMNIILLVNNSGYKFFSVCCVLFLDVWVFNIIINLIVFRGMVIIIMIKFIDGCCLLRVG